MPPDPCPYRRRLLKLSAAYAVFSVAPSATQAGPTAKSSEVLARLVPNGADDQTAVLQAAIDAASAHVAPLILPAGTFRTQTLQLRPGSVLTGASGLTTLLHIGQGPLLAASNLANLIVSGIDLVGNHAPAGASDHAALVELTGCQDFKIADVVVRNGSRSGVSAHLSRGLITTSRFTDLADAAIFSLDSTLVIAANTVIDCGNNGILVWRSTVAEDGCQVTGNRISQIRARSGGTGQNGNGINVYRAGSVTVSGNRITDCAFSAVRGNSATNLQIIGNHCERLGEVALYAEFAFTGALIANNVVDTAASGISVTNFNEGGRLAVVHGNLLRNLVRRENEPVDKRGEGITVEADTVVTGNTIEAAATCGILLGWGRYMRDVNASSNLIRDTPVGILISADKSAGRAMVTGNLISGTKDGAIRAHENGRPFGPDLAREPSTSGRVTISGNSAG